MKPYLLLIPLLLCLTAAAQTPPPPPPVGSGSSGGTFTTASTDKKPPSKDKTMGLRSRVRAKLSQNATVSEGMARATEKQSQTSSPGADEPAGPEDFGEAAGFTLLSLEGDNFSDVENYLASARELADPGDAESVLALFELYALAADARYTEGETEAADELFDAGEELIDAYFESEPDAGEAAYLHTEIGFLYYELSDYGMAAYHFSEAYRLMPDDAESAYMVASSLALEDSDPETALSYLETALYLDYLELEDAVDIAEDSDLDSLRDYAKYTELAEEFGF